MGTPAHPRALRAALAPLALLAAAACRGPEHRPEPPPAQAVVLPAGREGPAGDPEVERHIGAVGRVSEDEDGRKVLELDLWNTSGRRLELDCTIEWLDREGRPLGPPGTWWRVTLEAGGKFPLSSVAPGPGAESWRLRAMGPAP